MPVTIKIPSNEKKNTLRDPKRWKKHYRSFKRLPYAMSFGSKEFRDNWDNIRWDKHSDVTIINIGGITVAYPKIEASYSDEIIDDDDLWDKIRDNWDNIKWDKPKETENVDRTYR